MLAWLLVVLGAALVVTGVTLLSVPAGFIAAGVLVLVGAVLVDLATPEPAPNPDGDDE